MRKPPPIMEWHIAENEAEWAGLTSAQTDHTASLTVQRLSFYKNACWVLAFVLGLVLALGGWRWPNAPTAAQQAVADYNLLVADLMHELAHPVVINDRRMLTGIPTSALDTHLEPTIVLVERQGEQAIVSIVTAINTGWLICREQRLYHHTASGWQQTVLAEEAMEAHHQPKTVSATLGAGCKQGSDAADTEFIPHPCPDQQMNPVEQHRSQRPPTYAGPDLTPPICPRP